MDDFERELKEDFLDESLQLLEDTEQSFLALEDDKESTEILDQIFRLAHNLKGTSRAVGFGEVAEFTHEMENLILKVKTGDIPVTDPIVSLLLESNDHITMMIQGLKVNIDATFESADIVSKIQSALSNELINEKEDIISESSEEVSLPSDEEINDNSNWETDESVELKIEEIEESSEADISPAALEALKELGAIDPDLLAELEGNTKQVVEEVSDAEISPAALEALKELGDIDPSLLAELEGNTKQIVEETSTTDISPAAIEALKELGGCDEELIADLEKEASQSNGLKFTNAKDQTPSITKLAEAKAPVEENKVITPAAKKSAPKKVAEDESIRVSLSRVEKLNNVVGELVILQTVLDQARNNSGQDQLTNKSISQLGKLSKEIQEISMSLRMVPVKSTLQKMSRIVRDTSKALDKKVKLLFVTPISSRHFSN